MLLKFSRNNGLLVAKIFGKIPLNNPEPHKI